MATTTHLSAGELRARLSQRIQADELELPVLPDSAAQVLSACNDSASDSKKLANLIQRDPSLAGHVLRISNSAAYAPREPIVSLSQAVSRLGMQTLCDISVAVAMNTKVFVVRGHESEVRDLWIHSAMTGAWAREVARLRRRNVEGAFLAGLLHDIGKPVLLQAVVDLVGQGTVDDGGIELAIEEFHADMGAALLERWSLPAWMSNAVRWHHAPDRAGEDSDLAGTVALADALGYWSQYDTPEFETQLREHAVLAQLGLYVDELEELMSRREAVESVSQAFA